MIDYDRFDNLWVNVYYDSPAPCCMSCYQAAKAGHRFCLEHLHKHGFPMDKKTAEIAAKNGNYICLSYAVRNGCPIGLRTRWHAYRVGILKKFYERR